MANSDEGFGGANNKWMDTILEKNKKNVKR